MRKTKTYISKGLYRNKYDPQTSNLQRLPKGNFYFSSEKKEQPERKKLQPRQKVCVFKVTQTKLELIFTSTFVIDDTFIQDLERCYHTFKESPLFITTPGDGNYFYHITFEETSLTYEELFKCYSTKSGDGYLEIQKLLGV